jgi:hypothetical protein
MNASFRTREEDMKEKLWTQGLIMFRQGRLTEARDSWERLLIMRTDARLIYALGELCLTQYDMAGATAYFGRYLRCLAASDCVNTPAENGLNLSAA